MLNGLNKVWMVIASLLIVLIECVRLIPTVVIWLAGLVDSILKWCVRKLTESKQCLTNTQ